MAPRTTRSGTKAASASTYDLGADTRVLAQRRAVSPRERAGGDPRRGHRRRWMATPTSRTAQLGLLQRLGTGLNLRLSAMLQKPGHRGHRGPADGHRAGRRPRAQPPGIPRRPDPHRSAAHGAQAAVPLPRDASSTSRSASAAAGSTRHQRAVAGSGPHGPRRRLLRPLRPQPVGEAQGAGELEERGRRPDQRLDHPVGRSVPAADRRLHPRPLRLAGERARAASVVPCCWISAIRASRRPTRSPPTASRPPGTRRAASPT